jgi:hypothetical protein
VDDCDDDDPAINPGADEVCDSLDNNCDGQVDEVGGCGGTVYNFGGFLPPVGLDRPFKLGSAIPVKFLLSDDAGNAIATAVATLSLQQISGVAPPGEAIEEASVNKADSGNEFRYSASDELYVFNLNTKRLSPGTWLLTVALDDGTIESALIALK